MSGRAVLLFGTWCFCVALVVAFILKMISYYNISCCYTELHLSFTHVLMVYTVRCCSSNYIGSQVKRLSAPSHDFNMFKWSASQLTCPHLLLPVRWTARCTFMQLFPMVYDMLVNGHTVAGDVSPHTVESTLSSFFGVFCAELGILLSEWLVLSLDAKYQLFHVKSPTKSPDCPNYCNNILIYIFVVQLLYGDDEEQLSTCTFLFCFRLQVFHISFMPCILPF